MQRFMGNPNPNLFTAQTQQSDARRAIADQMSQNAMASSQSDPMGGISKALIANYLTGQAGQQGAQAQLLGPQNAVQRAGILA